jgi:hypothetical protein
MSEETKEKSQVIRISQKAKEIIDKICDEKSIKPINYIDEILFRVEKDDEVRVSKTVKESLITICEEKHIRIEDLVNVLLGIYQQYDIFNENWYNELKDKLTVEITKQVTDEKLNNAIALQRNGYVLKAKSYAFNEYIKVMPPEERRTFLENLLKIDAAKKGDFLDNISQYGLVTINGVKTMMLINDSGDPVMKTDRDVISCEMGLHSVGSFCKCRNYAFCKIKKEEETVLRLYGPEGFKSLKGLIGHDEKS